MKIYQIFFDVKQELSPEFIPYFNKKCSVYFENEVICNLIGEGAHLGSDYFGVVSYNLKSKLTDTLQWKAIFRPEEIVEDFNMQRLLSLVKTDPDVISLAYHPPQDQIKIAERFHPGFTSHWRNLMLQMGLNWRPEQWGWVSYCNFFVAKTEIYEDYVKNWLMPAIGIMEGLPKLNSDCGYKKPYPEKLLIETGFPFYTWHSFLLERLFSFYVHTHKLKAISY